MMDFCSHSGCEHRRLLVKVKLLSEDLALSEDLSANSLDSNCLFLKFEGHCRLPL